MVDEAPEILYLYSFIYCNILQQNLCEEFTPASDSVKKNLVGRNQIIQTSQLWHLHSPTSASSSSTTWGIRDVNAWWVGWHEELSLQKQLFQGFFSTNCYERNYHLGCLN